MGGDLLRSPSLIDRWAVRPAGLMLGNIPNSTNSAVLKTAVPSGTTLWHTSANSQLAVQVPAQIVPKAQANLVLAPIFAEWMASSLIGSLPLPAKW